MTQIHKLYRKLRFSLSERRTLAKESVSETPETMRNLERWKKVIEKLKQAPTYEMDEELKRLVNDADYLRMIASSVELRDDGTTDWLPETALRYAEQIREEFTDETKIMEGLHSSNTAEIGTFIDRIQKAVVKIDDIDDQLKKRAHVQVPGITSVDQLPEYRRVQEILLALKPTADNNTEEKLGQRQMGLLNLAREIVRSKTLSQELIAEILAPNGKIQTQLTAAGLDSAKLTLELQGIVGGVEVPATDIAEYKKKIDALMEAIIRVSSVRLIGPAEEIDDLDTEDAKRRNELSDAKTKALRQAQELKTAEDDLLQNTPYEKDREAYFTWLRGHRVDIAIYKAFEPQTKKFDKEALLEELQKIKPDTGLSPDNLQGAVDEGLKEENFKEAAITKALKLIKEFGALRGNDEYEQYTRDNVVLAVQNMVGFGSTTLPLTGDEMTPRIQKALLAAWNPEPLNTLLEENGFNRNYIIESAAHINMRSYIGHENADTLINHNLSSLTAGFLIDLSEAMGASKKLNYNATKVIVEYASSRKDNTTIRLSKDEFIDAMTFVFLDKGNEQVARASAEASWNSVTNNSTEQVHECSEASVYYKILGDPITEVNAFLEQVCDDGTIQAPIVDETLFKTFITERLPDRLSDEEKKRQADTLFEELAAGDDPNDDTQKLPVQRRALLTAMLRLTESTSEIKGVATTVLTHLADEKAEDKGGIESLRDVAIEAWGSTTDGATRWWEWMSGMPQYYLDTDIGEKLLALDDRRQALLSYAHTIDVVLSASNSSRDTMQNAIDAMRAMQKRQDAVSKPLDVAHSSFENVDQAYILLKTSKLVIDELDRKCNWESLPTRARHVAFWHAMQDPQGGIDKAVEFVTAYENPPDEDVKAAVLAASLSQQQILAALPEAKKEELSGVDFDTEKGQYIDAYIDSLDLRDIRRFYLSWYIAKNPSLGGYLKQYNSFEETSERHILDKPENKFGLRVRPMAMQALMGIARKTKVETSETETHTEHENSVISSMRVDRWMLDRSGTPEQRDLVYEALDIVIEGPPESKDAFFRAFFERKSSMVGGEEMTPIIADEIVQNIQTHLRRIAGERQRSFETFERDELYSNPLERGLRGAIDTIKDLWQGDITDKAMLIGGLVTAVYLIRRALSEGGKDDASPFAKILRASLLGIPLLILVNKAVKNRTGRDYMGEWLKFTPKEERTGALEQFRHRSKRHERYAFLGTNAGHEAIRQLSGSETNVSIKDLLAWRSSVTASPKEEEVGHAVYSVGMPEGIDVQAIMYRLDPNASREEACKLAYLAFEALLVDVGTKRGARGSLDQRAEQGADIIMNEYVTFEGYRDRPEMRERMRKRNITMMDVLYYESFTPGTLEAIDHDDTFVEWFAGVMGWTVEEAHKRIGSLATTAALHWERTGEIIPDLWGDAWEYVDSGVTNIYDFYRKVKPRAVREAGESVDTLWRLFLNTADAMGIVISKAPEAGKLAIRFTGDASEWTLDRFINLYALARSHSTIGNLVNYIEDIADDIFGVNVADLLSMRGIYQNDEEYVGYLSSFERMHNELQENIGTIAKFEGLEKPETVKGWLLHVASKDFGIPNEAAFEKKNAHEKMAVYEKLKRKLYSLIIAERIDELKRMQTVNALDQFTYPVDIRHANWNGITPVGSNPQEYTLANKVEETFGFNTLSLIATEKDWAGLYQQWLIQDVGNTARPPLQFLHFVINFATMDEQSEHLLGSIELFTKQFTRIARRQFGNDEHKMRLFKSYLETIVTNVALEAAMGAKNGQERHRGPAQFTKAELTLLQNQAVSFITYLETLRGYSADARHLEDIDLSTFESKTKFGPELSDMFHGANGEKFLSIVQSRDPANPTQRATGPDVPAPILTQEQVDETVKDFDVENADLDDIESMLTLIERAPTDTDRRELQELLDKVAEQKRAEWENLDSNEALELAFNLMCGVTDDKLKNMQNTFFDTFRGWGNSGNLQKLVRFGSLRRQKFNGVERSMSHSQLSRIQDTLDRTVQGYFDDLEGSPQVADAKQIMDRVPTVAELKANNKTPKQRKQQYSALLADLAQLYNATILKEDTLTVTADMVLLAMEHIVYVGDNTSPDPDENGKTGFDKFASYMKDVHNITVPKYGAVQSVNATASRMQRNAVHSDGGIGGKAYLEAVLLRDNWQIFGGKGHITYLQDRLNGME